MSSVAAYEALVAGYNAALLGCDAGWTRYLDTHVGVECYGGGARLDAIAPKLCDAGVGFHAHSASSEGATGSIWTAGVGALGVEFKMNFDWAFFNKSATTLLDYCSADSSGVCSPSSCDLNPTYR